MDEKEFRKLKRQDFLELLLTQGQELADLQERFDKTARELELSRESNDRLKRRLDEKDALIERLKERLDAKDARIRELRGRLDDRQIKVNEAGSIAMAALKLNGIFETAQRAADQYLENLKAQTEGRDACKAGSPEAEPPEREGPDEADMDLAEKLELNRKRDLEESVWEEREKAELESAGAQESREESREEAVNTGEAPAAGKRKGRRRDK